MKKILFIAPNFFKYHIIIKEKIEEKGYIVDYFDDRPSTGLLSKCLIRINKKLIKRKVNKYFNKIYEKAKVEQYTDVLVILGQSFNEKHIIKLKSILPDARFVFYMWDAIENFPDRLQFSQNFDCSFTFDQEDAEKYENFKFLPLFIYSQNESKIVDEKYDACFIGTIKKGKYNSLKKIFSSLEQENLKVFSYMYLQSKLIYYFYKMFDKDFKKAKKREFKYKKLSLDEINDITSSSKYIIDCPMYKQNGQTIRIFETIAAKKKIITTNKNIKNYDFYCPENIYVFNDKIDINDIFFNSDYKEIDKSILEKYNISKWLDTLLEVK